MNNENLPIIDVSWGLCGYIYNGMKKKKIGDHSLLGRKKRYPGQILVVPCKLGKPA
jgi:hypothetical protein